MHQIPLLGVLERHAWYTFHGLLNQGLQMIGNQILQAGLYFLCLQAFIVHAATLSRTTLVVHIRLVSGICCHHVGPQFALVVQCCLLCPNAHIFITVRPCLLRPPVLGGLHYRFEARHCQNRIGVQTNWSFNVVNCQRYLEATL